MSFVKIVAMCTTLILANMAFGQAPPIQKVSSEEDIKLERPKCLDAANNGNCIVLGSTILTLGKDLKEMTLMKHWVQV
jgi:hypothetical protein